jgi:MerR family transcriptional regulator, light-induced transcriptional regulator
LAKKSENELSALVESNDNIQHSETAYIDSIISSLMNLDEESIFKSIEASITEIGFERAFEEVIIPLLHKIGLLWQGGTIEPAREHFLVAIIEKVLQQQIALLKPVSGGFRVVLMQLPGDTHELSLLYIQYLFRKHNVPVLYLGVSVPPEDISSLLANNNNKVSVYVHTVMESNELFLRNLNKLIQFLSGIPLFMSGKATQSVTNSSIIKIESLQHLKTQIAGCCALLATNYTNYTN